MKFPSLKKKDGAEKPKKEKPVKEKQAKASGGKGSRTRLLLLVLLLVILGGAGAAFYLGIPIIPGFPAPESAPAPKQTVQRKSIEKPQEKTAITKPVPKPPQQTEKKAVTAKPVAKEAAKVVEEAVGKEQVAVAEKPAAEKQNVPTDKKAVTEPKKPVEKQAKVAAQTPVQAEVKQTPSQPMSDDGKYTVVAGTFLLDASLKKAQADLKKLGFEPQVKNVVQSVEMTRFRADIYPDQAAAAARVRQLQALAPDSFFMKVGNEFRVYVGSFYNIDNGRRFADKLYTRGVLLEEEPVTIKQTLQQVRFGAFKDKRAAEQAAAKVRKAGLNPVVVERR